MPPAEHRSDPGRRHLALGALALCGLAALARPARAQSPALTGIWALSWRGARDTYEGTLEIHAATTPNVYAGRLLLRASRGGIVNEDASIVVTGNQVRIECSNPTFQGFESWSPDRFYLTRKGPNRMVGYSLDAMGNRGKTAVFERI
ncbi:MAG: hypothetical protein EXR07_02485 [Acetobacteraceae bacterium]|nr:hypothetical protein [Acetobacteraceae bacterium]